ncbi:MAG TPA: hypothetical protein VF915_13570, partial [Reyranella sp.]
MVGKLLSVMLAMLRGVGVTRGGAAKLHPLVRRLLGSADLRHQPAQMRFFDHVEPSAPVLRRIAPRVGAADEGAVRLAVVVLQLGQRDDLVDDVGQLVRRAAALDQRCPIAAVEVVGALLEATNQPDVETRDVLPMGSNQLLCEQAVGTAQIRLAGALGDRLRLPLAPVEAQLRDDRDRVDEDRAVRLQ